MSYPSNFTALADKEALLKNYKGKRLQELPTPSFIIDRNVFQKNSDKMLHNSSKLNAEFRAHVKTHKSTEGTLLQLGSGSLKTDKVVVSTLMEAWNLVPLVEKGLISDMLFSLPVVQSRLDELADLSTKVPKLRLMLDSPEQLDILTAYNNSNSRNQKWSLFIKINMGTDRAGLLNDSEILNNVLTRALNDKEIRKNVEIYGFYCHAGHSYSADSENKAKSVLIDEINHANKAAKAAIKVDPSLTNLQLSVGATPTAHASEILSQEELENVLGGKLSGILELHAGNYPCCDLQQVATGCVSYEDVSCKVIAEVISTYPDRGSKSPGEQLVNAGVIALAREFGPLPGHGRILEPRQYTNWIVGRISQEHGILTPLDESKDTTFIPLGTQVSITPQHSCITAASYPWYFVVDGSDEVVDIWVPWRGW